MLGFSSEESGQNSHPHGVYVLELEGSDKNHKYQKFILAFNFLPTLALKKHNKAIAFCYFLPPFLSLPPNSSSFPPSYLSSIWNISSIRYGQYFVILLCFYIYEFSFLFPLFQVNILLRVSKGQKAGVLHKTLLALVSKA